MGRGEVYDDRDEVFSVIADDTTEVGFIDFEDDQSVHGGYDDLYDSSISISAPFPLDRGKPQSASIGRTCADSFTLRNISTDPVELWSVRIFASNPKDSFVLSLMKPPLDDDTDEEAARNFLGTTSLEDRMIQPGQALTIWLSCKPQEIGMHTSVVHFDLGDEKIERVAFLLAEDRVSQSLASSIPYNRPNRRRNTFCVDRYVAGTRPARTNACQYRNRLPEFNIPVELRELIENQQLPEVLLDGLNRRNYAKFFSTLLVMEEVHLEEEMRGYNMECVTMRRRGNNFLTLEVPGLAEKRPSLICGDYIFAKLATNGQDDDCHPFQGYIHRVEADEIYLKFEKGIHMRHHDDDLYNIRFTYNRTNMRRLYQAIHEGENLGPDILFPSASYNQRIIKNVRFAPFNPNLNREQSFAIEKILGYRGLAPYVIHGPPGTGKTMTLVEAILQICNTQGNARILVCASSNSAADHVLEKLISWDEIIQVNKVFRLNAPSRPYEDVKPDFLHFCFFDDMIFRCPPPMALLRYKVIVSTYTSASLIYAMGVTRGSFTHIFLDEAGQASEPETMVPLANLCCRKTTVVLAGDPMQLGPVVFSKVAGNFGLQKSYLERLFESEPYGNGDENFVMKLLDNYRCHPAILDLPSRLFYNGELVACRQEDDSAIYDLLDIPNKAFPILFVGIQGCDEREGNDPSWFNRIEASKVVELIAKFKRSTDLTELDIGVITPYRQQVLKIKTALETMDLPDLKVGSVEQFQGQERNIIIISTVRSTVKHNEFDLLHNLGFLSNPQRFNVAITRAKILLAIVGNPHIITKDRNWDKLLRYCAENGSYQGCPLPPPEVHSDAEVSSITTGENLGPSSGDWEDYIPEQHPNLRW